MSYTAEQVLSLSPNAGNRKRGQGLATPAKWPTLAIDDQVVWGECKGSGKNPYRSAIDLQGPAFKCSCPSREFPCKHGIGLFLLYVGNRNHFEEKPLPEWAGGWIEKRRARQEKQAKPEEELTEEQKAKRAKSKANTAARREKKMTAGLEQLEIWIKDLIRNGLGTLDFNDHKYWEGYAARMVDAQTPGVAGLIREIPALSRQANGTQAVHERLGELYYLIEGFKHRDQLTEEQKTDLKVALGIRYKKDEILMQEGLQDQWVVLGIKEFLTEDKINGRRTWLKGIHTGKDAMLLDFDQNFRGFGSTYLAGQSFEGGLVFYPGTISMRALFKSKKEAASPPMPASGYVNFEEMLGSVADNLAINPLMRRFPVLFKHLTPLWNGNDLFLRDDQEQVIPVAGTLSLKLKLLSISGGMPVPVFGEWANNSLVPLSAILDQKIIGL